MTAEATRQRWQQGIALIINCYVTSFKISFTIYCNAPISLKPAGGGGGGGRQGMGWCPKPVLWELNSFLMQTLSFVPINLHRCWPRK